MVSHDDHDVRGGAGLAAPVSGSATPVAEATAPPITASRDDPGTGGIGCPYLRPIPVAVTNAIG